MQIETKRRLIAFGTLLCVSATFAALQRFESAATASPPLNARVDAPLNVDAPAPPPGAPSTASGNTPPPADAPAKPADSAGGSSTAPGTGAPAANPEDDDKSSPDVYEGIPPEELPPDLEFNADDSVSFPTNI
jgi:hypothetical protein